MSVRIPSVQPASRNYRLFRIAGICAACFVMAWVGVVTRRPFSVAESMRAENDRIRKRTLTVDWQNQRTRREIEEIQTTDGKEREARQMGYLRPDEVRIQFVTDEARKSVETTLE